MKFLFYLYSFLYLSVALLMEYGQTNLFISKTLISFATLTMLIPCCIPVLVIVYPKLIKSNRSDAKYMNYLIAAAFFRIIFLSIMVFGLRDHMTILFLNVGGLLFYAIFIDRFILRIDNEYFKY